MELIGQISGVSLDPITKKGSITFSVNDLHDALVEYERLKDKDLRITAKVYKAKRTLSANAYFWVLLSEVARVLKTSTESLHLRYIKDHPYVWLDDDGRPVAIALTDKVNVDEALPAYWKQYGERKDNLIQYLRIKGTSEMTTQEMAIVLDDLVDEAKSLGIQTATPDEIERMKMYEEGTMEHIYR